MMSVSVIMWWWRIIEFRSGALSFSSGVGLVMVQEKSVVRNEGDDAISIGSSVCGIWLILSLASGLVNNIGEYMSLIGGRGRSNI